jgi:hypothetical protein
MKSNLNLKQGRYTMVSSLLPKTILRNILRILIFWWKIFSHTMTISVCTQCRIIWIGNDVRYNFSNFRPWNIYSFQDFWQLLVSSFRISCFSLGTRKLKSMLPFSTFVFYICAFAALRCERTTCATFPDVHFWCTELWHHPFLCTSK